MEGRQSPGETAAHDAALRCIGAVDDSRGPSPSEVVLRHEDRAEEWHFDEAVHQSRLVEHRELSVAFKERERQAKSRQNQHSEEHEEEIAKLLAVAEADERRCALELAGLREELVESQHQIEDMEEDCEQQVKALEHEMRAERQKRAALEEELLKAKLSVEQATLHIAEIEDREGQLMRLKRTKMSENRSACHRQCLEVQRSGEREIQEIGRGLREEVGAIQGEIDKKKKENKLGVDSWVKRRREVSAETEKLITETVDTKVCQALASVQLQVLETRETSLDKIKEVQARDSEQEAILSQRIGAALVSVDCSVQERDQIALLEKYHKKQLEMATGILGCSLPANRHNNLQDSRRVRNVGALALGT